jgi:hypothetical protein
VGIIKDNQIADIDFESRGLAKLHQVVDRINKLINLFRHRIAFYLRAGPLAALDQAGFFDVPQGFPGGMPAYLELLAELVFSGKQSIEWIVTIEDQINQSIANLTVLGFLQFAR